MWQQYIAVLAIGMGSLSASGAMSLHEPGMQTALNSQTSERHAQGINLYLNTRQSGMTLQDTLTLNAVGETGGYLYIQPGATVVIDMDVTHLQQMVDGCQALLGYSSTYFNPGFAVSGDPNVWSELIYENWSVADELDLAIGVKLNSGPVGTQDDGTVAKITVTARNNEGTTRMVFRPDGINGYATMLSDLNHRPIYPVKIDSQWIVIDGTPPVVEIVSAKQNGVELLVENGSITNAVQGVVDITITSSDNLSGLEGYPEVTVTPNGGTAETVIFVGEGPTGTFHYSWTVTTATPNGLAAVNATVPDRSGNNGTATVKHINVNRNQINGMIQFETLVTTSYQVTRNVTFQATQDDGTVLKTWNISVDFTNNGTTKIASGNYLLTAVPDGTVRVSAKTNWTLRRRQPVVLDGDMQSITDFVMANGTHLLGGDLDNSNLVNILDYAIVKIHWFEAGQNNAGNINGDPAGVQLFDYALIKNSWFMGGDPP
jgi:hypothetical protein